jgi:hypothetical protein
VFTFVKYLFINYFLAEYIQRGARSWREKIESVIRVRN